MDFEKGVFGKGLVYVRTQLNEGTSKAGKEYSICRITLLNGFESFDLDLDRKVFYRVNEEFGKGELVDCLIDIEPGYQGPKFIVRDVKSSALSEAM